MRSHFLRSQISLLHHTEPQISLETSTNHALIIHHSLRSVKIYDQPPRTRNGSTIILLPDLSLLSHSRYITLNENITPPPRPYFRSHILSPFPHRPVIVATSSPSRHHPLFSSPILTNGQMRIKCSYNIQINAHISIATYR